MKRPIFDKTASVEKRIDTIEKLIPRMAIRSKKQSIAIIPPVPLSAYAEGESVNGVIFRSMLFKGKITKGAIRFGAKPKGDVVIDIRILDDSGGITGSIITNKIRNFSDFDLNTSDGSILEVSITPMNPEDKIQKVWLGILWTPYIGDAQVKNYLIDELVSVSDGLLEE
jgi:hypothetical protein